MPTRDDIEAATPRCPQQSGAIPNVQVTCNLPLRCLHPVGKWTCSVHGPVLTYEAASQRRRQAAGLPTYDQEAA